MQQLLQVLKHVWNLQLMTHTYAEMYIKLPFIVLHCCTWHCMYNIVLRMYYTPLCHMYVQAACIHRYTSMVSWGTPAWHDGFG